MVNDERIFDDTEARDLQRDILRVIEGHFDMTYLLQGAIS